MNLVAQIVKHASVVLGMWLDWRHADAGVGIGMPALVLVKNDDYGYTKSQNKSVFAIFVFYKKFQKQTRFLFENFPPEALLENTTKKVSDLSMNNH